MKRPKQHYPLVEIIWDDAAGLRHGWTAKDEMPEPQLALSVGFLLKETVDHVVIAMDTDTDGAHNGRSQIPRAMIRKITVLRKVKQPKVRDALAQRQATAT